MQKSYCYTPGVRIGVCMQNVRANVKVLEFYCFCIFFLHFNFAYHTNKAPFNKKLTTGAHPVTVAPLVIIKVMTLSGDYMYIHAVRTALVLT